MLKSQPISLDRNLLIEASWEACWQLGGIYTVLRSKAPATVQLWSERYCQVGPWHRETAAIEFEELPKEDIFGKACELLNRRGFHAYYGQRLITGKPKIVLIDYLKSFDKLTEYKYFLWKNFSIDTPNDSELNDVVLFGFIAAEFCQAVTELQQGSHEVNYFGHRYSLPLIAHFHEWMAGIAIPEIHRRKLPVATVFTTHATLLGRYLSANGQHFYENLPNIDPDAAASNMGIFAKYSFEKIAAKHATIFTTISEITGHESENLLGRKPDALVPNGLNIQRFAALHEFQNLHLRYKQHINDFVQGHFFPSYSFDLDKTIYLFISGRYEYGNKGIDLYIEALARLNWRLKCMKTDVTVVAFIITKAPNQGFNVDVLKSQAMVKELRKVVSEISGTIAEKLFLSAASNTQFKLEDLLDEYAQVRIKRMTQAWRKNTLPAIVTHNMLFDSTDPVLCQLRLCNLINNADDRVKVVFHPEFLNATSPILGLDYEQFVRGCHLGVFPSYYEPWGYTPMECAALGIPAITSSLAGFGTYISKNMPDHNERGLFIVDRKSKNFNDSANQLVEHMCKVILLDRRNRVDQRNRVEAASALFDWNILINNYSDAHKMALTNFI